MENIMKKAIFLIVLTLMIIVPAAQAQSVTSVQSDDSGTSNYQPISARRIIGDYSPKVLDRRGKYYFSSDSVNQRWSPVYIGDSGTSTSRLNTYDSSTQNVPEKVTVTGRSIIPAPRINTQRSERISQYGSAAAASSTLNLPLADLKARHEEAASRLATGPSLNEQPRSAQRIIGSYSGNVVRRGRYYHTGIDKIDSTSVVYIGSTTRKADVMEPRRMSVGQYAAEYRHG